MKKILFLFALLAATSCTLNAANKVNITRIDPTDWYVGLKNPSVQLMVYGNGIREADVSTSYPGAVIDSLVRLDSPNYLLVYMNLKDAQPGEMTLNFTIGKQKKAVKYLLREREMSGEERMGFTNEDVLYMLMPDRFASSGKYTKAPIQGMRHYTVDRSKPSLRHGGDLEGLRQHLDYFNDLGVTALWFTPVLENDSPDQFDFSTYHGYATTDYYRVDPRFGTNEEYRQLTDEAHQKGLKIVMDMIFNHCGFEHPWVADMPSNDWFNLHDWLKESGGTSDSRNTSFLQTSYKLTPVLDPYASEVDRRETVEGWFVSTMPDLNQRNTHVMTYLIQNSIWWIETIGIDGIRMDTYPYAFADGMARWMKTLDEEYPNFNVVGETWVTQPAYTATWQKDSRLVPKCNSQGCDGAKVRGCEKCPEAEGNLEPSHCRSQAPSKNSYLKTVMDFSFQESLDSAKHEETDNWWRGYNRLYISFVYDYLYENPNSVMAFLDNHDTNRFLEDGQDALALKQGLALLLTIPRIPQLYYGTEIMMNGTKHRTDGNVRKDFPGGFPGDARSAFTAEGRTQAENDMFNFTSRLLHWRQGNEVITKGRMTQFIPHNGIYVIARRLNGRTVMTILNGTSKPATMEVKRYEELIGTTKTAADVITGRTIDLSSDVILTPRETLILEF